MCELYNTLSSLCNQNGVTGAKMCRECGLSKSLMSDLKYGRRDTISTDSAIKIANYFGVTVEEVLTGIKKSPAVENDKGSEFNDVYKQLNDDSRATMLELAKVLLRGQS